MRILIANDDGIYSPGIAALAEVASEFGSVRVVAPDLEQSSMGHAITKTRTLFWFTVTPIEGTEEGTDQPRPQGRREAWAVERGIVSLTPLRLDLTDERKLTEIRAKVPLDEAPVAAASLPVPAELGK